MIKKVTITTVNPFDLTKIKVQETYSPFEDINDFLDYYKWIATEAPIEELKAFADFEVHGEGYSKQMERGLLYQFQLSNFDKFSESEFKEIISHTKNDPFYSDFYAHQTGLNVIIFYVVAMAEIRAFAELSDRDTQILKWYWIGSEDFIVVYQQFRIDYIIAKAYQILGYRWFCEEAYKDSIRYQYVIEAIFCAKKYATSQEEIASLKKDLFSIYENVAFSISLFSDNEKAMGIVKAVQKALEDWDHQQIQSYMKIISELENRNKQLIDEHKEMKEVYKQFKQEVGRIRQTESNPETSIDEIMDRVYKVTNPTKYNDKNLMIEWDKLTNATKRDINASWGLFQNHQNLDLAILPLLRSIEREFIRHFINPFHSSCFYKKIETFDNTNSRNQITHKCLLKGSHLTMGNIPFLGEVVVNENSGSEVINQFRSFLDSNREMFITICRNVGKYTVGTEKMGLILIRNGIAHGDDTIIDKIDEQCYEDICNLLYDEPIRLLNDIVNHSMYL